MLSQCQPLPIVAGSCSQCLQMQGTETLLRKQLLEKNRRVLVKRAFAPINYFCSLLLEQPLSGILHLTLENGPRSHHFSFNVPQ